MGAATGVLSTRTRDAGCAVAQSSVPDRHPQNGGSDDRSRRGDLEAIANVIERNAGIWGARRDVVNRVQFAVQQTIEAIIAFCAARGPIRLYISYDEFVIDAVLAYDGAPLEFPTQPPTSEEIVETEHGARRLAGFLIRRFADRMRATRRNDQTVVYLHFDH